MSGAAAEKRAAANAAAADATELPIGTVEKILEAAPGELKEDVVKIPEWGCSVKVRTLTAKQQSRVRQQSVIVGKNPDVAWAEMEIAQFLDGVVEPKFEENQVRQLHKVSGPGFARVIDAIDEISNLNKEEIARAQQEFPRADD